MARYFTKKQREAYWKDRQGRRKKNKKNYKSKKLNQWYWETSRILINNLNSRKEDRIDFMAKMNYDRMTHQMENSKSEYGDRARTIKWPQGTHVVKLLEVGNEYDGTFYRETMAHQSGEKKDFRKWICWDWVNNDHERRKDDPEKNGPVEGSLKSILIKEGKLTKSDWAKYKKYGCPSCVTDAALAKIGVAEEILNQQQKKFENICQIFYVFRRVPKEDISPKPPECQHYVWFISTKMRNDIIKEINEKRMPDDSLDEEEAEPPVEDPLSLTEGCNLMVRAEGEGQYGRKYSIQFKGKAGQKWYREIVGTDPKTGKVSSNWLNPEDFVGYDLVKDVEMKNFLSYQKTIEMTKNAYGSVLDSVEYKIKGDTPEEGKGSDADDPLYAKQNREKTDKALAKPKSKNLDEVYNKSLKDEMDADDPDADIDEEATKKTKTKSVSKTQKPAKKQEMIEQDEDGFDVDLGDEEEEEKPAPKKTKKENSFTKQVPPSDGWGDDEF